MPTHKNPKARSVRLFGNGRNQAVPIPVEFELPGDEATISREDDRLIITPVRKKTLLELLDTLDPIEETFAEINDPPIEPENIFEHVEIPARYEHSLRSRAQPERHRLSPDRRSGI